jgi:chitinase
MPSSQQPYRRYAVIFSLILALLLSLFSGTVLGAPKDRKAPTVPTGLKVTSYTDTTATLAWNASTDNVSVSRYRVYRGMALAGSTLSTTYTASGLTPGTTYSFTVRAVDAAGNLSRVSTAVKVTTLQATPVPATPESNNKSIIGYYTSWSTYGGKQIADLDASKLTHINYAFANIGADLRIALGDSYADVEKRFPNDLATDPFFGNFNQLLKLKQKHPHLKTFISVGGWSWSGKFSDVALTDASRTAFAESCVAFIVKYGFDGVDIDWEYPVVGGMAGNVKRPEDKTHFTLLMQTLRNKLDAQSAKDGKRYLLSFAGASSAYYTNNVELPKLQQYVDFVNIMAYDIHGTWDSLTGLNAPLFRDPNSAFAWDTGVSDSVQLYLSSGVPADKLVMGVPFYGYKYNNVANANNGLYQRFAGGTSLSYAQVVSTYLGQGYTRYFHPASKVPYLFNGSTFITYDDPESIQYKAAYVKEKGIAGAMVWSLGHDTSEGSMLSALHRGLQ